MEKKVLAFSAAGVIVVSVIALIYSASKAPVSDFIDPSNRALVMQGKQIYANNCASCHGVNMEGQPDWRTRLPNGRLPAPPHDKTGHTWHHPDAVLIDIVKNGLVPGKTAPRDYASDMPAYGTLLSDSDIIAVLAYIKSSWPPRVLEAQKKVTSQREN